MSNRINFLPPWVETNMQPAFYDKESGSCLQQTARMYAKVNQLVRIANEQWETIADYINKFIELKDFVEDYFENLDVQEEINNKLDSMVEDGTLSNIIGAYIESEVDPRIEAIDDKVDQQNEYIADLNTKILNIGSGSPLVATSTSEMTDTTRVYVNTSNGKWYYYDGDSWEIGGTYQSTGIDPSNPEIDGRNIKLDNTGLAYDANSFADISGLELGNIIDAGTNNAITFSNSTTRVRTPSASPITVSGNSFTLVNLDPTTYKAWVWYCNSSQVRSNGSSGWIETKTFQSVIPSDYPYIYIVFARIDNATITVDEVEAHFKVLNGTSPVIKSTYADKKSDNLKNLLGFQAGDVDNSGKLLYASQYLATRDILQFNYDLYIPYNDYCYTNIALYNQDNTFNRRWLQVANDKKGHVIKAGTKFRLVLAYVTTPSPTPNSAKGVVESSELYRNFEITSLETYRNKELSKLKGAGYSEDVENLKYSINLNIGDINASGLSYQYNENRRLITTDILHYDFDVVIPKTNSWMFYLYTYDDASGTNQNGEGWKYPSTGDITIPANTFWRMVITVNRNSTDPIYNLYDNNVFKALAFYKKPAEVSTSYIEYNANFRSVAHQGYSTTGQPYGNCRLSSYVGAKTHGFDYGECDLQWTSDMIPVCCHDASFNSGGDTIVIAQHTLAELQTYDYYGETIASFEQVLAKCKALGLGLYIDKASFDATHFNIISAIVDKYQMQDNVYWLLQGAGQPTFNLIDAWYKKAKYSVVLNTGVNPPTDAQIQAVVNFANANKTEDNYISIDVNSSHFTTSQLQSLSAQLTNGVQVECWTIDDSSVYEEKLPYVRGITSNRFCYNDVYEDIIGS